MYARGPATLLRIGTGRSLLPSLRPAAAVLHPHLYPTKAQPLQLSPSPSASTSLLLLRRFWSSSAAFFSPGPRSEAVPQSRVNLKELDVDGAVKFAMMHGLDAKDAAILKEQKIDGGELLRVTKEELERWGMLGGPAWELVDAVKAQAPGMGDKLRAAAQEVRERTIEHIGYLSWEFLGREDALVRIAVLNIRNNFLRERGNRTMHSITIPVAMHTDGVGTSEITRHYVLQLEKDDLQEAVKSKLLKMGKDGEDGEALAKFASEHFSMLADSPPLTVGFTYYEWSTSDTFFRALHEQLKQFLQETNAIASSDSTAHECKKLLSRVLEHIPVFLYIDEIGGVRNFDDYKLLRTWLGSFYDGLQKHNFPLHVYLCGRFAHEMQGMGNMEHPSSSSASDELILLQPFGVEQVKAYWRSMVLRGSMRLDSDLSTAVVQKVVDVTGGIPRLIDNILTMGADLTTEAEVAERATLIASHPNYEEEFAHMDDNRLRDFASCIAAEELDLSLLEGEKTTWVCQMVRALPVLAARQDDGSHKLKCCQIWAYNFMEPLKALNCEGALATAAFSPPFTKPGKSRELDVLRLLGERMLPFLAAARIPSEKPSIPGTPVEVDLSYLFPFLFWQDSTGAYPVLEALGEDRLPWELTNVPTYFRPRFDELRWLDKEATRGITPETVWQHLEEVARQATGPDAAAFFVAAAKSHPADVFFHVPPGLRLPFNLISLQVEGRLGSNQASLSVIETDCIANMARNVPGRQIHVVLADGVNGQLGSYLKEQPLVLQGEVNAEDAEGAEGADGADGAESKERAGGDVKARVVSPAFGKTDPELRRLAEALPNGAVLVVLDPKVFQKLMQRV